MRGEESVWTARRFHVHARLPDRSQRLILPTKLIYSLLCLWRPHLLISIVNHVLRFLLQRLMLMLKLFELQHRVVADLLELLLILLVYPSLDVHPFIRSWVLLVVGIVASFPALNDLYLGADLPLLRVGALNRGPLRRWLLTLLRVLALHRRLVDDGFGVHFTGKLLINPTLLLEHLPRLGCGQHIDFLNALLHWLEPLRYAQGLLSLELLLLLFGVRTVDGLLSGHVLRLWGIVLLHHHWILLIDLIVIHDLLLLLLLVHGHVYDGLLLSVNHWGRWARFYDWLGGAGGGRHHRVRWLVERLLRLFH